MTQYPTLTAGPLSVADLQAMVANTVVKPSDLTRTSTSMLDDPDLAGIALGVGTWEVDVGLFAATPTSNTQDLRTQWSFTGTWNTPTRFCQGPGATNTTPRTDITPVLMSGTAVNVDSVYGLPASSNYNVIREWSKFVVVTVAGNLALVWAENAFSANGTVLKAGSYMSARQIA